MKVKQINEEGREWRPKPRFTGAAEEERQKTEVMSLSIIIKKKIPVKENPSANLFVPNIMGKKQI